MDSSNSGKATCDDETRRGGRNVSASAAASSSLESFDGRGDVDGGGRGIGIVGEKSTCFLSEMVAGALWDMCGGCRAQAWHG